jgi:hypothetical protein
MANTDLDLQTARSYVFRHLVVSRISEFETTFGTQDAYRHAHEWYKALALFEYPEHKANEPPPADLMTISDNLDNLAGATVAHDIDNALVASNAAFDALLKLNAAFEPILADETLSTTSMPVMVMRSTEGSHEFGLAVGEHTFSIKPHTTLAKTLIDVDGNETLADVIRMVESSYEGCSFRLPGIKFAFGLPGDDTTPMPTIKVGTYLKETL